MTNTFKKDSGRLARLTAALAEQKDIVLDLVRRLTSLGSAAGMQPKLFGKFMAMLEDVAIEKQCENEIISRIHAMEQHHLMQRKSRKLKPASRRVDKDEEEKPAVYKLPVEKGFDIIDFLVAMALLAPRNERRKKSYALD